MAKCALCGRDFENEAAWNRHECSRLLSGSQSKRRLSTKQRFLIGIGAIVFLIGFACDLYLGITPSHRTGSLTLAGSLAAMGFLSMTIMDFETPVPRWQVLIFASAAWLESRRTRFAFVILCFGAATMVLVMSLRGHPI